MPYPNPAESKASKQSSWPTRILGIALVLGYALVVQWIWGWSEIIDQWRNWSIFQLFAVIILILSTYLIRAVRIWEYFRTEPGVNFSSCIKLTLLHNLANNLLPMRSGEASFPLLMRSYFGLSISRTTGTLLWFRFLDLLVVLLLGAAAWMIWSSVQFAYWMVWFVALCSPLLIVSVQELLLTSVLRRLPEGKVQKLANSILSGMPRQLGPLLRSLALTWANWSLKLGVFALIILVFTDLNKLDAFIGALGGELSSILPVHAPAGLGTYEAGVVAGAVLTGGSAEQALQGGVNLHILLILATLIGGLLALLIPSKSRAKPELPS